MSGRLSSILRTVWSEIAPAHVPSLPSGIWIPSLPVEIWIPILTDAIRPEIMLDNTFKPHQIEAYYAALADDKGTKMNANALMERRKNILRRVCRNWRDIMDSIQSNWVLDFWPPIRSEDELLKRDYGYYERLNVLYYTTSRPQVKLQYPHPISTLTLHVCSDTSRNEFGTISSFQDILLYPKQLRALHLRFSACQAPHDAFKFFEHSTVNLTTLSLNLMSSDLLHIPLTLPRLVTLFLAIPNAIVHSPPLQVDIWNMPSLENLSTEWHPFNWSIPMDEYPFYEAILRKHLAQIRVLRIDPLRKLKIESSSAYCWSKLPRLEAIATDFELFAPITTKSSSWPESSSIRHIIQIGNARPQTFWEGLKLAMTLCPHLESVSIPSIKPSLSADSWKLSTEDSKAIRELRKVCQKRNIRILDHMGEKASLKT